MKLGKNDNLAVAWIVWHFYEMPGFLLEVWKNYLAFATHYFSIPLLLATLLSPWRRYRWNYPRGFNIGEYAGIFISNVFSRIIGAVCRLALVAAGMVFQLIIFFIGLAVLLLWVGMPFFVIALVWYVTYA
jgi:hypothetical protein